MADTTMAADTNDRLFLISENIAKLMGKVDSIDERLKEEHARVTVLTDKTAGEIKDLERSIGARLAAMDAKLGILKDDFDRRFVDIKVTLGKYSVLASLAMTVLATIIKTYMGK